MRGDRNALIQAINEEFEQGPEYDGCGVCVLNEDSQPEEMLRVEIHTAMGAPLMFCDVFSNGDPATVTRVLRATVDAIVGRE